MVAVGGQTVVPAVGEDFRAVVVEMRLQAVLLV
jgi:hypothetical protein